MEFSAPKAKAETEIVIRKSRFIGHAFPVFSEEEALKSIESVKKQHPNATHNVFAYSVGVGNFAERAFDDGEPKGTAGYPVLDVIKKRNLSNVACVVTRYFGGTKLGAGGLVRAYSNTASSVLDKAGLAVYKYHNSLTAVVSYSDSNRVQREIETQNGRIENISYEEEVTFRVWVLPEAAQLLSQRIKDITSDSAAIDTTPGKYLVTSSAH